MDIANLQAFLKVAELRSFSLAAQALYLTQPAVSKRIAQLEQEMDVRLFDRIGRSIHLTEAGRALLPGALNIVDEVNDTQRRVANLSGQIRGQLRIGTSHHIGLHRLPDHLKHFGQSYPEVDLDLQFMDSETACVLVERGELELAVVTLPSDPDKSLKCTRVWEDPLVPVIATDHELADHAQVTLKQLVSFPSILPGKSTFTRTIIQSVFNRKKLELNTRLETNYLETIHMMVRIGLGWSVLPETMLTDDLLALDISELHTSRQLGLVVHNSRTLSNAATAFSAGLLPT
jgi:DNA-binding transcriptional LysR family regulator